MSQIHQFPDHEYDIAPPFNHEKNIKVGHARVIYVDQAEPGWALPGRRFTADFSVATDCAIAMDRMMRG